MTDGQICEHDLPDFEYEVLETLLTGTRTSTFRVCERGGDARDAAEGPGEALVHGG